MRDDLLRMWNEGNWLRIKGHEGGRLKVEVRGLSVEGSGSRVED